MLNSLSGEELKNLLKHVFPPLPGDKNLAILIDFPDDKVIDNSDWRKRREMAFEWTRIFQKIVKDIKLERVNLLGYPNVGSNNADLPNSAYLLQPDTPFFKTTLSDNNIIDFYKVFQEFQLFLAPTQLSATAPLKLAAKRYGFRAATMPGFSEKMIPALRIDFNKVNERCLLLKAKLDASQSAFVRFLVRSKVICELNIDLRMRNAHASTGQFCEAGTAGNLPSGETYIVPYEGEFERESETKGILPVQFGKDIVYYEIYNNKAIAVTGGGRAVLRESDVLESEPAYGNIAELGFGVLADFGIKPVGKVLLDEKLGFHVAFGRSDHFGGRIGPKDFSSPEKVVHIDRIYLPETQPDIVIEKLDLKYEDGRQECIISARKYTIF